MHSFLPGLEHFFIRIRTSIVYLFESLKIALLDAQFHLAAMDQMNVLTPDQQKKELL